MRFFSAVLHFTEFIVGKNFRLNLSALFYTEKLKLASLSCQESLFNSIFGLKSTFILSKITAIQENINQFVNCQAIWSLEHEGGQKEGLNRWLQLGSDTVLTLAFTQKESQITHGT